MMAVNPLLVRLRLPRDSARSNAYGVHPPAGKLVAAVASGHRSVPRGDFRDRDNDASNSSASTPKRRASDDDAVTSARPTRRRKKTKPTYAVRKEERATLAAEMKRLGACVEELRARAGMPSRESLLDVATKQQQTRALEHAWRRETLTMCGVQSVVGNHLRAQHMSPLHTRMRLGKDLDSRKNALEDVRREKLDIGYRYLQERFRDVDDREPFCELQQWTSAQGDLCFRRADILVFEGVRSAKQVMDALLFFFLNMEISISEQLGQLTLRDDIDAVDTRIVSHRIMTSTDHGLEMEMNAVGFSEYYQKEDGEEVALLVTDTVDEDELHPYATTERVRKDISGAITMKAFRRPRSDGDCGDDQLVVAMKRCVFLSILTPQFPISKAAREDLRTNIAIWGEVMATTMKEYLRI